MPAQASSITPSRPRRRFRWRALFKWSGLAVCVLMVVVFAMSLWRTVGIVLERHDSEASICRSLIARSGCVSYVWSRDPVWANPGTRYHTIIDNTGRDTVWWPRLLRTNQWFHVMLPLWLPFTALAIPTAILFHRDHRSARRARAGACVKCGYNLVGIAPNSPCPECGTPLRPNGAMECRHG